MVAYSASKPSGSLTDPIMYIQTSEDSMIAYGRQLQRQSASHGAYSLALALLFSFGLLTHEQAAAELAAAQGWATKGG